MPKQRIDLSQLAYITAQQLAEKREQAIIAALDAQFGAGDWLPEDVANICEMHVYGDGMEEFLIEGEVVLRFYPIISHTELVEIPPGSRAERHTRVVCSFFQEIENKYNNGITD